jgi:hypothetical protein
MIRKIVDFFKGPPILVIEREVIQKMEASKLFDHLQNSCISHATGNTIVVELIRRLYACKERIDANQDNSTIK